MANETEKKGFAHLIGYIKNALSLKADKTEIPSLTGYATQTWVEGKGYQTKAITDTGGYFTTDTVEGALQEIGAELAGINTLIGNGVIS